MVRTVDLETLKKYSLRQLNRRYSVLKDELYTVMENRRRGAILERDAKDRISRIGKEAEKTINALEYKRKTR